MKYGGIMKILTLMGSPRKKGNTAAALNWMEQILIEKGHEINRVNLTAFKLEGCLGCYKCQGSDGFTCIQKDELNDIYSKMEQAEAVVFASPLYFWSFSAQFKPVIDRFICQVKGYGTKEYTSSLMNKPTALLVTSWGPVENNSEYIVGIYQRAMKYLKSNNKGELVIPGCGPDKPPADNFKKAVRDFAIKLV